MMVCSNIDYLFKQTCDHGCTLTTSKSAGLLWGLKSPKVALTYVSQSRPFGRVHKCIDLRKGADKYFFPGPRLALCEQGHVSYINNDSVAAKSFYTQNGKPSGPETSILILVRV